MGDWLTKPQVPAKSEDDVQVLTPAQCQKVKEAGPSLARMLATEALVNGGCNYNGPKVAKSLVT